MASVVEHSHQMMWTPKNIETSNMDHFRRTVNHDHSLNLGKFGQLKTQEMHSVFKLFELIL